MENSAVVAPGNSPGIITVDGNYTQNLSGALNVEIAGSNPATPEFDQLIVNGTVTLGGALSVSFLSGYVAPVGTTFRLIDNDGTDAVTGTFSGYAQGSTFTVGYDTFQISYTGGTGNDVVLTVTAGPRVWDGGGDGVTWNDANNWDGNTLPTAGQDVYINGVGVIISSGTVSVRSVISSRTISITGGSFAVAQASEFNAGVNLSGGTLTANGVVTLVGNSSWTGGTIGGTAGVANNGTLTISSLIGSKVLGTTLTNAGTVTQTAGFTLVSATMNNLSGGDYALDGDVSFANISGTSAFNNAGTFRKLSGAGTSPLGGALSFNNQGGTVDVVTGTLSLRGGTSTGGTFNVAVGSVLDLSGGQTQTITGSYTSTGGGEIRITGTGALAVGAAGATINFPAGMFRVVGSAGGNSIGSPGNTLTNLGEITLDTNGGSIIVGGTLNNTGTIKHTGPQPRPHEHRYDQQPGRGHLRTHRRRGD